MDTCCDAHCGTAPFDQPGFEPGHACTPGVLKHEIVQVAPGVPTFCLQHGFPDKRVDVSNAQQRNRTASIRHAAQGPKPVWIEQGSLHDLLPGGETQCPSGWACATSRALQLSTAHSENGLRALMPTPFNSAARSTWAENEQPFCSFVFAAKAMRSVVQTPKH